MSGDAKILRCGAVEGRLKALYKRFEAVNKAAGPFVAIFCVGPFLGADEGAAGDLPEFLSGVAAAAPVPTFFTHALPGGRGALPPPASLPPDGCVAPNLFWLAQAGVRELPPPLPPLRVAALPGAYDPLSFADDAPGAARAARAAGECRKEDVEALLAQLRSSPAPVDLLLTSGWPRGVAAGLPPPGCSAEAAAASAAGAPALAALAAALRPRYHVAGGAPGGAGAASAAQPAFFYLRPPYRNPRGGPGAGCTRFLSLAPQGAQPASNKWLYALGLTPCSAMTPAALAAAAPDATASPYEAQAAPPPPPFGLPPAPAEAQPWRWAAAAAGARPAKRPRAEGAGPLCREATVFVRNLPFSAGEEELSAFFAAAGTVVDVRLAFGPDGRPRGFGHVEFDSPAALPAALALSGGVIAGREVTVEAAASDGGGGEAKARRGEAPVCPPGKPMAGCWFCLSNDKDTHLVASIGEHCYVAVDKGALVDGHVLLVPVEHYACSADLPPPAAAEAWRYITALRACFAQPGGPGEAAGGCLLFERHFALRGKGGNHAHVNALPLPPAAAAAARAAFLDAAQRGGYELVALPAAAGAEEAQAQLRAAMPHAHAEYFLVTLPDGERLLHVLQASGPRFGMQFGREVCAHLLGCPSRADWRECTTDQAGEEGRTAAFKQVFEAFDPFR